ncbi:hypothetical protein PAHAL_1G410200 [Panicum hallii]|uniref:Uncharacterized protein n=1 Tax=Panicum hallii TaxID=206008 RepID=A0A2T8KXX3_9POAL|nr:hypothetical protein PAHAL_1G410200 [Panicum hallii]
MSGQSCGPSGRVGKKRGGAGRLEFGCPFLSFRLGELSLAVTAPRSLPPCAMLAASPSHVELPPTPTAGGHGSNTNSR